MGRPAKIIEGTITRVSEIQDHKGQFRLRYYRNGILEESYRAKREDAEALLSSLLVRQETNQRAPGQNFLLSNLSQARARAAELAFQELETHGFVSGDTGIHRLSLAVRFYIEKARQMERGIPLPEAYEKFVAQKKPAVKPKTWKDYKRFVAPFVEKFKDRKVTEVTPMECKDWIDSFETPVVCHNCYGFLESFFKFCAGKHNPHVKQEEAPWLSRSPLNFPKPGYTKGDIKSYTYAEVVTLLKAAKDLGLVPYVIFRLFSMLRREEMERVLEIGKTVGDIPFINLSASVIDLPPTVMSQKGKRKNSSRRIRIHSTFNAWLALFQKEGSTLTYHQKDERKARRAVKAKAGDDNLIRHTGITMHLKNGDSIMDTSTQAGTSPKMIQDHYYSLNIESSDAKKFFQLTPQKARGLGIL
jgi:hypothetical protein